MFHSYIDDNSFKASKYIYPKEAERDFRENRSCTMKKIDKALPPDPFVQTRVQDEYYNWAQKKPSSLDD